jgi:PAS domain S-box-containing protein
MGDRQHAYSILEAETGEEALSLCHQQFPEVIFLDYELPDMNGLEFLAELKTQFDHTNFPVIMLTGQGSEQIAVQALKNGAAEYLSKNHLTPDLLRLAIQNVLEKQAALWDRRKAEETLQIYAAELEELYHHAPCGYHSLDANGVFIRINDTEIKMLGYKREELVSKKKFADLLTPDSLPVFQKNFPLFQQQGWVRDLEFQMLRKDGRILPVSISATAVKDTAGNYLYSRSIVVDISDRQAAQKLRQQAEEALQQANDRLEIRVQERTTKLVQVNAQLQQEIKERKQLELELLNSQQLLEAFFSQSLDGFFFMMLDRPIRWDETIDRESVLDYVFSHQRMTRVNAAMLAQYGASQAQFIGLTPKDFFTHDLETGKQLWQQMFDRGRLHIETDERKLDGTTIWIEGDYICLYNSEGEIIGHFGIQREVSDRKQAEQKIREQAALLDIASDAIFVCDLEHHILFWNQGAERLYGWSAAEVIGKKTTLFLCQKNFSDKQEALKAVLESGSWQGELEKVTKSGKKAIVNSRMTLVRDGLGNPKFILTVDTDITEKKQLESQFYQAQRLESLGTLASGIAHDMNNILTPILGVSQLLPLKFPNLDPQNRRLVDILIDNAKRGAALVKQILSFARGDEGKRVVLKPKHVIEEIEQIIQETFPKSIEIQIDKTTYPELWTILADSTQIHQVLMNLCVNARDAMPDGGILTITAQNHFFDRHYADTNLEANVGNYVVITVADTGNGISPEMKERIFDPFFTTKEPGKGTGLGLSTVIGIVKNHGGFVKVESEVGKGSQFQVCLPAIDSISAEETSNTSMIEGNGELILIVDDEASIREITKSSLEEHNYKTLAACDGIEALSIYEKHQDEIDLVLLDIQMPSISGLNVVRLLQQINPSVKIIVISGLTSNLKLLESSKIKVQSFLAKPYTIDELLNSIQDILKK